MKLNMKVRLKHKVWWITIIPAILVLLKLVLDLFGIDFDYTALQDKLINIVGAVFMVLSIIGINVDMTTEGLSDSENALQYTEPKSDSTENN